MMEGACLELLPVSRLSRPWRVAMAIAATAAIGSVALLKLYEHRYHEVATLAVQERATDELADRGTDALLYQASSKTAAMQRELPWPQALAALEHAYTRGVTLMNLEFSASEHSMQIEVNLANPELLAPYVDLLNSAPGSLRWIPKSTANATAGNEGGTAILAAGLRNR